MWICANCHAESPDASEVCSKCKLGKSYTILTEKRLVEENKKHKMKKFIQKNELNEILNKPNAHTENITFTNSQITAKELIINLKILLIIIASSFILYFVFYFINEPNYLSNEEIKSLQEKDTMYSESRSSKYDYGYIKWDSLNETRKTRFHEDIWNKTLFSFFILVVLLIGGRYALKGITWVNRNNHDYYDNIDNP